MLPPGIARRSPLHGLLSFPDLTQLQAVGDRFGAREIQAFFATWLRRLSLPPTRVDREAGYDDRLIGSPSGRWK